MLKEKKYYPVLWIVLLGVCLYGSLFLCLQINENLNENARFQPSDTYTYTLAGKNLYLNGFKFDARRPFLYPLLVGVPFLFSPKVEYVLIFTRFLNVVLWIGIALLLFKTLDKHHLSAKKSGLVALTFLVNMGNIAIAFTGLSETAYVFCLTLFVYYFNLYVQRNYFFYASMSFLALVFSLLIRPASSILVGFLALILVFDAFKKRKILDFKTFFVFGFSVVLMLVQLWGMHRDFGKLTFSSVGQSTLYRFQNGMAETLYRNPKTLFDWQAQSIAFRPIKHHRDSISCYTDWSVAGLKPLYELVESDTKYQLNHYLPYYALAFATNIAKNTLCGSNVLKSVKNINEKDFFYPIKSFSYAVSLIQNIFYTIALFVFLPFLFINRHKFLTPRLGFFLCFVWFMGFYLAVSSGISFYQGDRFHLCFVPIVLALFGVLMPKKSP